MKLWEKIGHPLGGIGAERYTFESFGRTKINAALYDYMPKFDISKDNAYISGPVGSGKTHAATGIAGIMGGTVIKLYQISRFVRWGMMQDGLDEGDMIGLFAGERISTNSYFAEACPMLVIDDLGSEKLTEFSEQILFEIIDLRISRELNGLIITSNLPLEDMAKRLESERITSRIAMLCKDGIFSLDGEKDHRVPASD